MTLEVATYLNELNSSLPIVGDDIGEGDDHIRMLKAVLKTTFPGLGGVFSRAISKAAGFSPATTENHCLFVNTAEVTCSLPTAAGMPTGATFYFRPLGYALTIAPASGETLNDLAAGTAITVDASSWAIVKKLSATQWIVFHTSAMTAAAIVAALGSTPVANATTAANGGVTSVAGRTGAVTLSKSDVGLSNVDNTADANKSVNYANSAGYAASAPANGGTASNSDMLDGYHYNNLPYAPMTAIVNVSKYTTEESEHVGYYLRFTRANGSYFDIRYWG
jgi:hypothetical protein